MVIIFFEFQWFGVSWLKFIFRCDGLIFFGRAPIYICASICFFFSYLLLISIFQEIFASDFHALFHLW